MAKNIGKTIRRYRELRGLSQGSLAKKSRVSLNTVVKLELGDNDNPTINTLESLAKALGVSVHKLI